MDPTDINKYCIKEAVEKNVDSTTKLPTEIKTGCMKWYVYDDSGSNYTMILDHNTTAIIQWNADNKNVAYENSIPKTYIDLLTSTGSGGSKWKVIPRLITAEEVNTITGKTEFDSTDTSSWYYLDRASTGINFHIQYANATTKSNYAWLCDYLYDAIKRGGANYNDNNIYTLPNNTAKTNGTYAYWLNDTLGSAGYGYRVWIVYRNGWLHSNFAGITNSGVRPVVTIDKSYLKI